MGRHPLEEIWSDIQKHTKYNTQLLAGLYKAIQQREAEKVPGDWRAFYVTLHAAQTRPIINKTHRRSSLTIVNLGPSTVLLSNQYFDGPARTIDYNAKAFDSTLDVLPLATGQSVTLPSSGAVYGYSIAYGTVGPPSFTNEQAVLQGVETLFDSWQRDLPNQRFAPGEMGAVEKGHIVEDQIEQQVQDEIGRAVHLA